MTPKDTALLLLDSGLSPVIIPPGEKGPRSKGWQHKRYTRQQIENIFDAQPDANVGVLLGDVIDIECDGPGAEAELAKLFEGVEMPRTVSWQARRGRHLLFKSDERLKALGKATIKIGDLEIRLGAGGKAAQSLLPPSTTDGFTRTWLHN